MKLLQPARTRPCLLGVIALATIMAVQGCVVSEQPLIEDQDAIRPFSTAIKFTRLDRNPDTKKYDKVSDEVLMFTPSGQVDYSATHIDKNGRAEEDKQRYRLHKIDNWPDGTAYLVQKQIDDRYSYVAAVTVDGHRFKIYGLGDGGQCPFPAKTVKELNAKVEKSGDCVVASLASIEELARVYVIKDKKPAGFILDDEGASPRRDKAE